MAFSLKGKTMAEATQMLDNALDKSDTGEQAVNGVLKIEDTEGNPIDVADDNQVITKNDWKNLDSKRYIILQPGEAIHKNYLPFTNAIYDNYNINDLFNYPTRINIPNGVTKVRFCINYNIPTTRLSAELAVIKNNNGVGDTILNVSAENYATLGSFMYISQIIDVKNIDFVQIYVNSLTSGYLDSPIHIAFNNITMEVLQ